MIDTQTIPQRTVKDGTGQHDREIVALKPDHVTIAGHSTMELIQEAQRLGKELRFFNEKNEIAGNWERFLVGDPDTFLSGGEEERKLQKERWARQLAAYVDNPDLLAADDETMSRIARPHTALFLTFLRLLNHLRKELNGLTKRHLDFYFRERLQLTTQEAQPDVVHLLIELAENSNLFKIEKGTRFLAGTDEEGNDLFYQADEDTLISKAKVSQLKNVFVDKQVVTLEKVYKEEGFEGMVRLALGSPNPGDDLPLFPPGATDLFELEVLIDQQDTAALSYLEEELCLSVEDFKQMLRAEQLQQWDIGPVDWTPVYEILNRAFKDRFIARRKQSLKDRHAESGLVELLKHVYGTPEPGDALPVYRGQSPDGLGGIQLDLQGADANGKKEAIEYIQEELKLDKEDFLYLYATGTEEPTGEDRYYQLLERANRQVRVIPLPTPSLEKIGDVYAAADAKAMTFSTYGDKEESKQFKTFGSKEPISGQLSDPANLGFAISSPTLLLREGKRQITLLLDIGVTDHADTAALKALLEDVEQPPFQVYLSHSEEWARAANVSFSFGNYLGDWEAEYKGGGASYEGNPGLMLFTKSEGPDFTAADPGNYLIGTNGDIYEFLQVESESVMIMKPIGMKTDIAHEKQRKYAPNQVYLNALKVVIDLTEAALPVVPKSTADETDYVQSEHPSLVLVMNRNQGEEGQTGSPYQQLMDLKFNRAHLLVAVEGIKDVRLQNDQSLIDARKPFEPFGYQPDVGAGFYLANEELSVKKLNQLDLKVEWVKAPDDFGTHYQGYTDEDDSPLSNASFLVSGFMHDRYAQLPLTPEGVSGGLRLFSDASGEVAMNVQVAPMIKQSAPTYKYLQDVRVRTGGEEVLAWDRYFRFELSPVDFQHSVYPTRLANPTSEDNAPLNPPYDPRIKTLRLGYTASTDLATEATDSSGVNTFYQVHPFGFMEIDTSEREATLLPSYQDEGALYLGVSDLEVPGELSILFQVAEGSATPDAMVPALQWEYLRENEWVPFTQTKVLLDTTNGLLKSGIVRLSIPAEATTGGTLLPDDLHWLRVAASSDSDGISNMIEIKAQAISATLLGENVPQSHFEHPLSSGTISEMLEPVAEIDAVLQPYSSGKGKAAEKDQAFYRRVSERIRHKNRALTTWDYEHMVLEKFPEIYKSKCIPSTDDSGNVTLVVIPDIRGKSPFDPFQPKVTGAMQAQIRDYLSAYTPEYVGVVVKNPAYLQVLIRCIVKFHDGLDETYHQTLLIEAIKQFLTPWAYDTSSDINIGGSLPASLVINFIAEQPYIDYVANLRLFQSEDGINFVDARLRNEGEPVVWPSQPDQIMASAKTHFIAVLDENGYDEASFEGIGFMEIQDINEPTELEEHFKIK